MFTHSLAMFIGLCFAAPVAQNQSGSTEEATVQPQERREAREGREPRGERRRERRERMRNATPEERQQMRLEGWVERTTRMYDLDEAQQVRVRAELAAIQQERRLAMGADAEEHDRLRRQMSDLWAKRAEEAGPEREARRGQRQRMRDDPEFAKLRERMREIDDKHPFDTDGAIKRLEALLPEEQVRKGQARREEWRAREIDRNRQGRGRDGDRQESRRRPRTGEITVERRANPEVIRQEEAKPAPEQGEPRMATPPQTAERELLPWEKYTREFITRHECPPRQANAAMSILKDVQLRAEKLRRANAERIAEAEKIPDSAARNKRLAELNGPVDQLFDELKSRLDSLLTAEQRVRAKASKT